MTSQRYFTTDESLAVDPISGQKPTKLRYYAGGQWKDSKTTKFMPCHNPSTGAVIAMAPTCTAEEVEDAIQAADQAYPAWRDTPVSARVQVLFRMKTLLDQHLDELTEICARENGKNWDESKGDVLKVIEVVEFACGAPPHHEGRVRHERLQRFRHRALQ